MSNALIPSDDLVLANRLEQLTSLANNAQFSRSSMVNQLLDSRRNYDRECGYPETTEITPEMYNALYERDPIANRVVEIWPKECWAVQPSVYEDEDSENVTPFEEAWDKLARGLRECGEQKNYYQDEEGNPIWELLSRADSVSGVGHYGVVLLGFDDGAALETPIEPGKANRLLYLSTLPQHLAPITSFESDPKNPRYGQPLAYNLTLNDPSVYSIGGVMGATTATSEVHWSRIIHLADVWTNSAVSNILAPPRMRPVLNRLQDLVYKLYGGSAEMFWRGAFPGLSFETHPQLGGDVELNVADAKDQYDQYINGLQRVFAMSGVTVKTVSPSVTDPSNQINTHLQAICVQIGVPMRIFMGSERGELASSQDAGAWDGRVNGRRTGYITPRIVVPFVNRLIYLKILPTPRGFSVFWNKKRDLTEMEQATLASTRAQAVGAYIQGGVEQLVTPSSFFTRFMGMDEDEAEAMLQEKRDEILEEEPADPLFAQMHPQGIPGVSAPPLGPLDQSGMGQPGMPGMPGQPGMDPSIGGQPGMGGEDGGEEVDEDGNPVNPQGQGGMQLPPGVSEEDIVRMAQERGVDPQQVFAALQDAQESLEPADGEQPPEDDEEEDVQNAIPEGLRKWKEQQGQGGDEEASDEEMPEDGQQQLTDEEGNPVDEQGNPLETDEQGNPVDEYGNPLPPQPGMGADPMQQSSAILQRIQAMREKWGTGGTEDLKRQGRVDAEGNPIEEQPEFDDEGNPIEDEEGNEQEDMEGEEGMVDEEDQGQEEMSDEQGEEESDGEDEQGSEEQDEQGSLAGTSDEVSSVRGAEESSQGDAGDNQAGRGRSLQGRKRPLRPHRQPGKPAPGVAAQGSRPERGTPNAVGGGDTPPPRGAKGAPSETVGDPRKGRRKGKPPVINALSAEEEAEVEKLLKQLYGIIREDAKPCAECEEYKATHNACGAGSSGSPGFQPGNTCAGGDGTAEPKKRGAPKKYYIDSEGNTRKIGTDEFVRGPKRPHSGRPAFTAEQRAEANLKRMEKYASQGRTLYLPNRVRTTEKAQGFLSRAYRKLVDRYEPQQAGRIIAATITAALAPERVVTERDGKVHVRTKMEGGRLQHRLEAASRALGREMLRGEMMRQGFQKRDTQAIVDSLEGKLDSVERRRKRGWSWKQSMLGRKGAETLDKRARQATMIVGGPKGMQAADKVMGKVKQGTDETKRVASRTIEDRLEGMPWTQTEARRKVQPLIARIAQALGKKPIPPQQFGPTGESKVRQKKGGSAPPYAAQQEFYEESYYPGMRKPAKRKSKYRSQEGGSAPPFATNAGMALNQVSALMRRLQRRLNDE